jgi:hypothetical protein
MSDGKGKGRASPIRDEQPSTSTDANPLPSSSILDRVAASAAGLGRSTFSAPSRNELSETAFAALGSSGKGQSSSGNSSSSRAEELDRTGLPGGSVQQPQPSSFRSTHRDEHVQNTEAEFSSFLDGIDSFTPSNLTAEPANSDRVDLERAWDSAATPGNASSHVQQQGYQSVEEQQMRDGEGVLELLSAPGASLESMYPPFAEEEAVNWNLSEEQLMVLRGMLDELFPIQDAHVGPRADHPLNLIPEASTLNGDEGIQMWMEQWEGVLTSYADEVWGDLLPLVQEAREEVQAVKDDPEGLANGSQKALRRLGLILGHLRGS